MRLTTFASGSGGNCALLSADGMHILLDAGISYRRIREHLALSGLAPEALSAVLITHEHGDHISGLKTFVKNCSAVPVFAPRTVANHLRYTIAGVEQCLHVVSPQDPVVLDGAILRCFHTPHDTDESVGWRVDGRESFALATDMGTVTDTVREGLRGADVVLIEANHDVAMLCDGPYPAALKRRILSEHGHLSNEHCGELAAYLADRGTSQIVLGHLSRENNTPGKAFRTVKAALGERTTALYVAPEAERLTLEFAKEQSCLV